MLKPKIIFFFVLFSTIASYGQTPQRPVVITEKVEVVEYDYEYLYIEFTTSASVSTFYPIYQISSPSEEQLFFEAGRNERLSFEVGIQQAVSIGNWSISTGIEIQHLYENFNYGEYQTREVEIYNDEGFLELLTVAIGDPVITTNLNQLTYLKIPFQFAYKAKMRKTNLNFAIGMNYHRLVFSNYEAKFSLNRPAQTLVIQDFNSSYLSLSGGISVTNKLSNKLNLMYGPYFNYGLNNIIDNDELSFGLSNVGIKLLISTSY